MSDVGTGPRKRIKQVERHLASCVIACSGRMLMVGGKNRRQAKMGKGLLLLVVCCAATAVFGESLFLILRFLAGYICVVRFYLTFLSISMFYSGGRSRKNIMGVINALAIMYTKCPILVFFAVFWE